MSALLTKSDIHFDIRGCPLSESGLQRCRLPPWACRKAASGPLL